MFLDVKAIFLGREAFLFHVEPSCCVVSPICLGVVPFWFGYGMLFSLSAHLKALRGKKCASSSHLSASMPHLSGSRARKFSLPPSLSTLTPGKFSSSPHLSALMPHLSGSRARVLTLLSHQRSTQAGSHVARVSAAHPGHRDLSAPRAPGCGRWPYPGYDGFEGVVQLSGHEASPRACVSFRDTRSALQCQRPRLRRPSPAFGTLAPQAERGEMPLHIACIPPSPRAGRGSVTSPHPAQDSVPAH